MNKFITGAAGTGKTYYLNSIREGVEVTASTGSAAVNAGGTTIHSWAGVGIGDRPLVAILRMMKPEVSENIRACSKLAIDEISMISGSMLDLINVTLKAVRQRGDPFGGIELIVVGDFMQLPPVTREKCRDYCFNSRSWKEAEFQNIVLTHNYRQSDKLLDILNDMRFGDLSQESYDILTEPRRVDNPVHLYALNRLADGHNFEKLREIKGSQHYFQARDEGEAKGIELLNKHCIIPRDLFLRPRARVMLLKNLNIEMGLINGSLGEVIDLSPGRACVKFDNGVELDICADVVATLRLNNVTIATRTQVPLRLAYALSIHKSQGLTLPKVRADLKGIFEDGQAYVALSRAKSLDGLQVVNMDKDCVRADPDVVRWVRGLN